MAAGQSSHGVNAAALSGPKRSRWRTVLIAACRLSLLILVGFLAMVYLLQDQSDLSGDRHAGQPGGEGSAALRCGTDAARDGAWRTRGGPVRPGPVCRTVTVIPTGRSRPALVYFYGNAMCLAYAESEFDRFRRLGLNVLIPDYLGYGLSGGKASEIGCRETAETAYQALIRAASPPSRIIAGGWSLGGAVAIDLASRRQVGGLIAFSTFTSTHDMALNICPDPIAPLVLRPQVRQPEQDRHDHLPDSAGTRPA